MVSEYISKIISSNDIIHGNAISDGQILSRGEIGVAGDEYNDRMEMDVQWDDMRAPASVVRVTGASNIPAYGSFLGNLQTLYFDDSTMEQVFVEFQMPHGYFLRSDIYPHVHWTPNANSNAGEVVSWGLEYTWANFGQVFPSPTTIYTNSHAPVDSILVANRMYVTGFDAISKSNSELSGMLVCRLFRDATGAGLTDDYGDDAGLLEFDIHYQINSRGSRQPWIK